MPHPIDPLALLAYVVACVALVVKYAVLIAIQGTTRMRSRTFRWDEDAAANEGSATGPEHPTVERVQHALRNDGESQPYVLVVGLVWVLLGAPYVAAAPTLAVYVGARWLHSWLMVRPRQPLRTRVFAVGQVALFVIVVDALRRALG